MQIVLPSSKRFLRLSRASVIRIIGFGVAAAAAGALVFAGLMPTKAVATNAEDSSLTVNWTGDTSSAASLQPQHNPGDFEYDEFKNIKVTVSQTSNLIDQAVHVDMSGFQGGTQAMADGTGQIWSTATNFMQAMQCWGDPTAANFRNTCEWGGRFANNNGLGFTVYSDNVYRVATENVSPAANGAGDVPFIEPDGTSTSGEQQIEDGNKTYPISNVFGVNSSNEQNGARVNADGTGEFDFQVETSIQGSEMGCGATAAQDRCYLVLVPRGTEYGVYVDECLAVYAPWAMGVITNIAV